MNWKYLIGFSLLTIMLAVVNNLRQPDAKAVDWIGGQKLLEEPKVEER